MVFHTHNGTWNMLFPFKHVNDIDIVRGGGLVIRNVEIRGEILCLTRV